MAVVSIAKKPTTELISRYFGLVVLTSDLGQQQVGRLEKVLCSALHCSEPLFIKEPSGKVISQVLSLLFAQKQFDSSTTPYTGRIGNKTRPQRLIISSLGR